jgi:tetratricopeptide (TPR) repeat protein
LSHPILLFVVTTSLVFLYYTQYAIGNTMTTLPDFDTLWNYDQPAETEQRFQALLALAEPGQQPTLQLLTQIARAQGLQRRFDDAHQMLDTVEAALTAADPLTRVRYLLERGRVYNSSGRPAEALPLFRQAWAEAQAAGEDGFAVDAAHMMAIAEPEAAEQLAWNLKALELAQRSTQERAQKWQGSLYNNIGWTYHGMGQYEKALAIFEQAAAWRQANGGGRPYRIARWCIGRTLRSLHRYQEALAIQQTLLQEEEGDGDGYGHEEIAECLLALEHPAEARPHFTAAYERLSQDPWLVANEPQRLERLKQLAT